MPKLIDSVSERLKVKSKKSERKKMKTKEKIKLPIAAHHGIKI